MSLRVDQLLNSCTVKINPFGKSSKGTGFFIAPFTILTCAHVVKRQVGEFIEVLPYGHDLPLQAKLQEVFPGEVDLAILQLQGMGVEPSTGSLCVYLDVDIQPGDSCYTYGYPDNFPEGTPLILECEGETGGSTPFLRLKGGIIRPGLSGSPLLNRRTGKVCGVIKFTDNRTSNGGGATPVELVFSQYPKLIDAQRYFHQRDVRWTSLLDPDADVLDSDWTYLDSPSQRGRNYFKALCFLIKMFVKWSILGRKAPRAFPFSTISLLIEHTLKGDLGQEVRRQRIELIHRFTTEVDLEGTGQARVLNQLDSQASVLIDLIDILVEDQQDVASISRLLWVTEVIQGQRSLIEELKEKKGNSYPKLEALKKKTRTFDNSNNKYKISDRIISRLASYHTTSNPLLEYYANQILKLSRELVVKHPKLSLMFFEKRRSLFDTETERFSLSTPTLSSVEAILSDLEKAAKMNPEIKLLRKIYILSTAIAGEKVKGGVFRAWSKSGAYHFSRRCKLYPERVRPEEMRQILCYETREQAERHHKPCKTCKAAAISLEDSTEFLGEEPE